MTIETSITISLSLKEAKALRKRATELGFIDDSEYVRSLIRNDIELNRSE